MAAITAKVICDSIYNGSRITTFALSYNRFVHSELMTHGRFSRNAGSSRAIPVQKMIDRATKDTSYPVYWGKNQKGMQAEEELSAKDIERARNLWKAAAESAARYAQELLDIGVHKQITNRLIENFQNIETVVTATHWANWYALRNHKDAQPEIKELAAQMLKAHRASTPRVLKAGEWHLPFLTDAERDITPTILDIGSLAQINFLKCQMSAARCSRVSYLNHEKVPPTFAEDSTQYARLMAGEIKHASPTQHQAMACLDPENNVLHGNYDKNWVQFRKTIEGENIGTYEEFTQ
jgi:thymidylate synthase ThyX